MTERNRTCLECVFLPDPTAKRCERGYDVMLTPAGYSWAQCCPVYERKGGIGTEAAPVENTYHVSLGTEHMQARKDIQQVLQEWAEMLKTNIHAENRHGDIRKLTPKPDRLTIYFWSTLPREGLESKTYHQAFGTKLRPDRSGCGVDASGLGIPIDDETGQVVAELDDKALHILFDLPHHDHNPAEVRHLLNSIMEAAYDRLKAALMPSLASDAAEQQALEEAYMELCTRTRKGELARTLKSLQMARTEMQQAMQVYKNASDRAEVLALRVFGLEHGQNEDGQRFVEELRALLTHPQVERVEVSGTKVVVHTTPIFLEHLGKRYKMGNYQLIFSEDGRSYISSNNSGKFGLLHPHHVGGRRDPDQLVEILRAMCLGNAGAGLEKLLIQREYAAATTMLIEFLSTYNQERGYGGVLPKAWNAEPPERLADVLTEAVKATATKKRGGKRA